MLTHLKKPRTILFSLLAFLMACNDKENKPLSLEPQTLNHLQKNTIISGIPDSMLFFGKPFQLSDQDIRERLDRELLVNIYFESSTNLILKRCNRYLPVIEKILKEEKVPDDFKYLCVIESSLSNATSPAGASGFWQFMPFTAPKYGLKISNEIDERLHLEKSTRAACALIKSNFAMFNNWFNACAAYNRGPGGLLEDLKIQQVQHVFDAELNQETARYVFRIMALKLIIENPKAYGFNIAAKDLYPIYQTKKISVIQPIENLATWSIQQGYNRKIIRLLNPWILGNKLSSESVPCTIEVPNGNKQLKVKHPL